MKKTKKELEVALAVEKRKVGELQATVNGLKDHAFYLMLTRKKN